MKNIFLMLLVSSLIGLGGCSNNQSEELTKEEQENIYREEVQKKLEQEKKTEQSKEAEEEKAEGIISEDIESDIVEIETKEDKFLSLPLGTQASIISTYLDERATANSLVDGGFQTGYSFDDNYLIVQVTSGAGSGHPSYLIELQEDKYIPIDGLVSVGSDLIEKRMPPQIEISLSELYDEYLSNESLYNLSNETAYNLGWTVEDFYEIKALSKVENEIIGTVNGVTNTVRFFVTIEGAVLIGFTIDNNSTTTIEYSPSDIQLYKDGNFLNIIESGEDGSIEPGESEENYIYFEFEGLEPYILDWESHQIKISPSMS